MLIDAINKHNRDETFYTSNCWNIHPYGKLRMNPIIVGKNSFYLALAQKVRKTLRISDSTVICDNEMMSRYAIHASSAQK